MELNAETLTKTFVKAGQQVFFDLLAQTIEADQVFYVFPEDPPEKSEPTTYGTGEEIWGVRLDFTGDFYGELFLYFSRNLAREITRQFLILNECDPDDADDCITDIIGEVANMMSGLIKNSLMGNNLKCMLGLPNHFHNQWITFEDPAAVGFRNMCTFSVFNEVFVADLVLYATG